MNRYSSLLILALLAASPAAAGRGTAFRHTVLPNGLTVVLHEDHSIPVVAVNIWYKVGSKNEEPGRTGFAHLFEHYMFEGSAHSPAGQYFQRVFGMGGNTNATTSNDRTDYYAVVPSENLEEVLRLESDRMGFLQEVINDKSLEKQRAIVKNEKRLRENQAYGGAWEAVNGTAWPEGHPYGWPVIGSMKDLDAATAADVKAFHSKYYRPNNAVIVLAGDLEPEDTLRKVRKWFGPIPAGPPPPPLSVPGAGGLSGRKQAVVADDKAQIPLLLLAYPIPGKGKPGWAEMSVVASVLGGGRSSRLVRSLQYDRRLAAQVGASVVGLHEADLFLIEAVPVPGVTVEQLVEAIEAELAKVVREGIKPKEMKRVQAGIRTARLDAMQQVANVAESLAEGQAVFGDAGALDALMERASKVKPTEAQAAAGRYLRPDNTAVVTINPKDGAKP